MADGSVMRRTVGAYVLPSGRELGPDGLIPDVVVPTIGDDATAEKVARDVLRGLAPAALDRG
jgi:C-terminal processing protease CtpA/Prc